VVLSYEALVKSKLPVITVLTLPKLTAGPVLLLSQRI
jgi:hypothetical protein